MGSSQVVCYWNYTVAPPSNCTGRDGALKYSIGNARYYHSQIAFMYTFGALHWMLLRLGTLRKSTAPLRHRLLCFAAAREAFLSFCISGIQYTGISGIAIRRALSTSQGNVVHSGLLLRWCTSSVGNLRLGKFCKSCTSSKCIVVGNNRYNECFDW